MVKPSGQTEADAQSRILDAADAVFVRHGIDGARMQEIANQAGVNKALLHYYFRSKEDLAKAVWFRVASSFVPGVFQMLASDYSLDEKIDRFVDVYHATLTRHPYLIAYVISEAARRPELVDEFYTPERRRAARRMIAKLSRQIDEQVEEGAIAAVSVEQFITTLVGSCLFPFAARPMLAAVLGLGTKKFDDFMNQRKRDLPKFLKRALKP